MSTYFTVITNVGAAKIAAALAANTSVPLASIAIGDGGGSTPTPVETQTALVNEVYRKALNKLYQDPAFPNTMVAEMIVPAADGGWTAREVGLVATDGTFIAVGNMPTTVKAPGGSSSASTLIIKLYFQVSSSNSVSLTIDPSTVVATESWVQANYAEADWNATTGPAKILNKPTLATVAITGAYSSLTGLPTLGTAAAHAATDFDAAGAASAAQAAAISAAAADATTKANAARAAAIAASDTNGAAAAVLAQVTPGLVKAYAYFNGGPFSGPPNDCPVYSSFNIASVVRTDIGKYTLTFTNPMPGADTYLIIGNCGSPDGSGPGAGDNNIVIGLGTRNAAGFNIGTWEARIQAFEDCSGISVLVI